MIIDIKKYITFTARTLLVSLLICLGTTGSAQETGEIGYGVKLGSTMNQFNFSGLTIGQLSVNRFYDRQG